MQATPLDGTALSWPWTIPFVGLLLTIALAPSLRPTLMGPLAGTLAAISIGASSMGALTYVGNAANLMIQAIATERGIAMPSFFGFMVWSAVVLLPVFALAG